MTGTEVVRPGEAVLAEFLKGGKGSIVQNPEEAMLDILRRTAAATTVDEVLGQQEATHARDVIGVPLTFRGYKVLESTKQGSGPDFYYVADCVTSDGEELAVTCGAARVMLQLYKLQELDALPLTLVIRELDHDTAGGNRPMWLERPESF